MEKEIEEVELCLGSRCPRCKTHYYRDGYSTMKAGDIVKCEKCGFRFHTKYAKNMIGYREIAEPSDEVKEPEIDDPRAAIIDCLKTITKATQKLLEGK